MLKHPLLLLKFNWQKHFSIQEAFFVKMIKSQDYYGSLFSFVIHYHNDVNQC